MVSLPDLDPRIHQVTRLRIMAVLYRNRRASFTWLRDALDVTDGNLASHARALTEAGFVTHRRRLTTKGFQVEYAMTPGGDAAFLDYVRRLRRMLADAGDASGSATNAAPAASSDTVRDPRSDRAESV